MKVKSGEEAKLLNQIKSDDSIKTHFIPPKDTTPDGKKIDRKSLYILLAYLLQFEELKQIDKADLDMLLKTIPPYIDISMIICQEWMANVRYFRATGRKYRRIKPMNIYNILEFSQYVVHGQWKDDSPFEQLPHFKEDKIKALKKINSRLTLENYCRMSEADRKNLNLFED